MFPIRIIRRTCFALLCIGFATATEVDERCTNKTVKLNSDAKYKFYKCPLPNGHRENTICCESPNYCCRTNKMFYEIDQGLGIIIAVSVVLFALLITILLIVCCCWEKCPLYMLCRREAKPDYIGHPDEIMALSPMPNENAAELKTYDPSKAAIV